MSQLAFSTPWSIETFSSDCVLEHSDTANSPQFDSMQDRGLDTMVETDKLSGLEPSLRTYGVGAQILKDLQVQNIRLLTNNSREVIGLKGWNLNIVERVPLIPLIQANSHCIRDQPVKQKKLDLIKLLTQMSKSSGDLNRLF